MTFWLTSVHPKHKMESNAKVLRTFADKTNWKKSIDGE